MNSGSDMQPVVLQQQSLGGGRTNQTLWVRLLTIGNLEGLQGAYLMQTEDGQTFLLRPRPTSTIQRNNTVNVDEAAMGGTTATSSAVPSAGGITQGLRSQTATSVPQTVCGGGTNAGMPILIPKKEEPLEGGEEEKPVPPVYVNRKQYYRILKRREARAKLEEAGRIPMYRPKYMHESRRQHAINRIRGSGGKFLSISMKGGD